MYMFFSNVVSEKRGLHIEGVVFLHRFKKAVLLVLIWCKTRGCVGFFSGVFSVAEKIK